MELTGATPRQINREFTPAQIRILLTAYPKLHKRRERDEKQPGETEVDNATIMRAMGLG